MEKTTIIVVSWNEKEALIRLSTELSENCAEAQVIYVDNGSKDGTAEWISETQKEYVIFDEGIQPMGKVLNTVVGKFLLNENVVLMEPRCQLGRKSMQRLVDALDIDERVGVVGACVSSGRSEQSLPITEAVQLDEIEEIRRNEKCFYTIATVGACFALKRVLIETVGAFREELATMDVMMDYQLRAIRKGFINRVACNVCVFDHGLGEQQELWINQLHNADYGVLCQIWNMTYFSNTPHYPLVDMIQEKPDAELYVLEVGCDMGANLLGIKNRFPNAKVYGVEINENAASIGKHILDIRCGNIESEDVDFGVKFDYIFFGDVLEHLHNPLKTITYCRSLLNENGRIVASIPNVMHVSVMAQLLRGEFHYTETGLLDKTHIHLFTGREIQLMFREADYEVEILQGIVYALGEAEYELIDKLVSISAENVTASMYKIFQYLVVARKK